jgi:hemin uptake protein HemP
MRIIIIHTVRDNSPSLDTSPPGSGKPELRRVSSRELLGPRKELVIDHQGREYRLRITQNGKLILTA